MGKNKYYCRYNGKIYNLSDVKECLDREDYTAALRVLLNNYDWDPIDSITFEDVVKFNNGEIPADFNEALEGLREENRKKHTPPPVPHCPRCGSTSITTGPRGFSAGMSLLSGLLGGNSVESGLIGSGNTVNRCANCGHTWRPKWRR